MIELFTRMWNGLTGRTQPQELPAPIRHSVKLTVDSEGMDILIRELATRKCAWMNDVKGECKGEPPRNVVVQDEAGNSIEIGIYRGNTLAENLIEVEKE